MPRVGKKTTTAPKKKCVRKPRAKKSKDEGKGKGQHNKQITTIHVSSQGSGGGGTSQGYSALPQFIPTTYYQPIQQPIHEPVKGFLAEVVKPVVKEEKTSQTTPPRTLPLTSPIYKNTMEDTESDASHPFFKTGMNSSYRPLSSIKRRPPSTSSSDTSFSSAHSRRSEIFHMDRAFPQTNDAKIQPKTSPFFAEAEASPVAMAAGGGNEQKQRNRGRLPVARTQDQNRALQDLRNQRAREKRAGRTEEEKQQDREKRKKKK
jgi:hypothetical protein